MLYDECGIKIYESAPWMEHRRDHELEPKAEFRRRADAHRAEMTLVMSKKLSNAEFRKTRIGQEVMSQEEIADWTRRATLYLERLDTGQYTTAEAYGLANYLDREIGYHTYADYDKEIFDATDEPYDPNDEVMNKFIGIANRITDVIVTIKVDRQKAAEKACSSPWDFDR